MMTITTTSRKSPIPRDSQKCPEEEFSNVEEETDGQEPGQNLTTSRELLRSRVGENNR